MPRRDFFDTAQVKALSKAFADYCDKFGIDDAEVRELVAMRVLQAFELGFTGPEEIVAHLSENVVYLKPS